MTDPLLQSLHARGLNADRSHRLAELLDALRRSTPPCRLRLNRNRRTMLSLRGHHHAGWSLSLHVDLLDHPAALAEIPVWLASRGRQQLPGLRHALQAVWEGQQTRAPLTELAASESIALPVLAGPLDLAALFAQVHATWFAHLPKPSVRWGRQTAPRRLSHIRFGSYRHKPTPLITVNPRLDQPWIARIFVEHVLHHELCHHAQACAPVAGETPHSPRFRAWERAYPFHRQALMWERANLARVLRPS